ncbi:Thioesterase/thiol ester dehydrase-isomerase [Lojkania enalia]|uniref:Thioesterase/thiol ester dehydrase-isomerase n=1 Tax=Lojkania enalia TaxID=147567 RepID=A0A9P4KE40_9PLEO|nr:Thioesterase/thiol ester dehydrase-isomerase [Didymosphaeria enalia]
MKAARSLVARSTCYSSGVLRGQTLSPLRRDRAWIKECRMPREQARHKLNISTASSSPTPQPGPTQATQPPPLPRRPLYLRFTTAFAAGILAFGIGFTMAAAPVLDTGKALLSPPTDEETLTLFTPDSDAIAEIEKLIFEHPLTQSLISDPKYIASRPHLKIPPALRSQNLTGGTLLGPDKIAVPPLQFTTPDGSYFVSLQYIGSALCGHPGIVHGGLLATLLDEGLARCCFPALPNKVAVTASLQVNYKKPALAGQVIVLKAETTKVEGRKAWVKGRLETLVDKKRGEVPVILTEAEALFIEPRQAATMKTVVT